MHPYLTEQVAAAHRDDLRRAALAICCARLVARIRLRDRRAAMTSRITAALARATQTRSAVPACCPA
jgi:hypothetical protein